MASRAQTPLWRETVKAGAARSGALIGAIAIMIGAILMLIALATYHSGDPSLNTASGGPAENWLGEPGAWIADICFLLFGPSLIDVMTASADIRRIARDYLPFVIFAPLLGVFAFAFDGVYIGATWARDMRNLMLASLVIFLAAWFALRSFGNAGLWGALLVHYAARGGLEALRYPALLRKSFAGKS